MLIANYTPVATESPTSQSEDNITIDSHENDNMQIINKINNQLDRNIQKVKNTTSGHNRFYCNGKLMVPESSAIFYLTIFLIGGTSALFFIFDCPFLYSRVHVCIPIVACLTLLFTMVMLLKTSFTDPGILPRATKDEILDTERKIDVCENENGTTSYLPPPRTREISVRGQPLKQKYCFTCKIFRPPRASHCSVCDNCVERFDHHCPWVGNCVGLRNYRYFYLFLFCLSLHCVFLFANVITHIVLNSRQVGLFESVKKNPASLVEGIICFFSVWSILGLTGFHTYLAASNLTTNEDMKGTFNSKHRDVINPFSRQTICHNYCYTLCGPNRPSLFALPPALKNNVNINVKPESEQFGYRQTTINLNHSSPTTATDANSPKTNIPEPAAADRLINFKTTTSMTTASSLSLKNDNRILCLAAAAAAGDNNKFFKRYRTGAGVLYDDSISFGDLDMQPENNKKKNYNNLNDDEDNNNNNNNMNNFVNNNNNNNMNNFFNDNNNNNNMNNFVNDNNNNNNNNMNNFVNNNNNNNNNMNNLVNNNNSNKNNNNMSLNLCSNLNDIMNNSLSKNNNNNNNKNNLKTTTITHDFDNDDANNKIIKNNPDDGFKINNSYNYNII